MSNSEPHTAWLAAADKTNKALVAIDNDIDKMDYGTAFDILNKYLIALERECTLRLDMPDCLALEREVVKKRLQVIRGMLGSRY